MKKPNSTKEGYISLFISVKHSGFRNHSAKGQPLNSYVIREIGKREVNQLSDVVQTDQRA